MVSRNTVEGENEQITGGGDMITLFCKHGQNFHSFSVIWHISFLQISSFILQCSLLMLLPVQVWTV